MARLALAVLLLAIPLACVPPADATVTAAPNTAADAMRVVEVMRPPGGLVVGASWTQYAGAWTAATSDAPIAASFGHSSFGILSTGLATLADRPQAVLASVGHASASRGAWDVTTLRIDVDIPPGNDCVGFTFIS